MDDNSSYNATSVWKDFSKAPEGKKSNNKLIHIRALGEFYYIWMIICVFNCFNNYTMGINLHYPLSRHR